MDRNFIGRITTSDRRTLILLCLSVIYLTALADFLLTRDVSLALLYLLPVVVLALLVPLWATLAASLLCAVLRESFGPDHWSADWPARLATGWVALSATALFVRETYKRRLAAAENETRINQAEEEARLIVESSPAAMITADANGEIQAANDAAERLLNLEHGTAIGRPIGDFFPVLADMLRSKKAATRVRTMVESRGCRADGENFFAQLWVSSFSIHDRYTLVAVVADVSEQMRDREELGLRQLLTNSHIIANAVSHEIRNLAVAAERLHENLGRKVDLTGNPDYDALGRLIDALRRLSAPPVPGPGEESWSGVNLHDLFKDLRIMLNDADVRLEWEMLEDLPRVRADYSALLQVMLNLMRNSQRALAGNVDAAIRIAAYQAGLSVVISFSDNGPGVARPDLLFQPFQSGAQSSGLGLYVCRAIVRTFGGELQYDLRDGRGHFVLQFPVAEILEDEDKEDD